MDFGIKLTRKGTALRFGSISFADTEGKSFPTPLILQYTRHGCIPFISWEVARRQSATLLSVPFLLPLPTSWEGLAQTLHTVKQDYREYCRMDKSSNPVVVSVHDPLVPIKHGYNNKAGIAIWSKGGRSQINSDAFIHLMKVMRPSIFQSLCDSDTRKDNPTNKRTSTSVRRTLDFLDSLNNKKKYDEDLSSLPVLGSVEGGHDAKSRHYSVQETVSRKVDGFVIEGFHSQGHPSDFDPEDKEVMKLLESTIALLPMNSPRMMFGSFSPEVMLLLFNLGIDILDSSYATALTEQEKALLISFSSAGDSGVPTVSCHILHLSQVSFKQDMETISLNCGCYCCRTGFSRSYIHHLITTKEMLASVLLNLHNLHVMQEFASQMQSIALQNGVNGFHQPGDDD